MVVTTTFLDEMDDQNEVREIASVGDGGREVERVEPLRFHHYGGPEYQVSGVTALLRAHIQTQTLYTDTHADTHHAHKKHA